MGGGCGWAMVGGEDEEGVDEETHGAGWRVLGYIYMEAMSRRGRSTACARFRFSDDVRAEIAAGLGPVEAALSFSFSSFYRDTSTSNPFF